MDRAKIVIYNRLGASSQNAKGPVVMKLVTKKSQLNPTKALVEPGDKGSPGPCAIVVNPEVKPNRKFVCERCPFFIEFPNEEVYLRHMDIAHLFNHSVIAAQGIQSEADAPEEAEHPEPLESLTHVPGLNRNLHCCQICISLYPSFEALLAHKTEAGHQFEINHCPQCDAIFLAGSPEFDQHLASCHPAAKIEKAFICVYPGCVSTFYSGKKYSAHMTKWHNGKLMCCDYCLEPYRSKAALVFHVKNTCRTKNPPWQNNVHESIADLNGLVDDDPTSTEATKPFFRDKPLVRPTKRKLPSKTIPKEDADLTPERRNQLVEAVNKPSKCQICTDEVIYDSLELLHHRLNKHANLVTETEKTNFLLYHNWQPDCYKVEGSIKGKCRFCDDASFNNRETLCDHEFEHLGIDHSYFGNKFAKYQVHPCVVCPKVFHNTAALTSHNLMHFRSVRPNCPQCREWFHNDSLLIDHLKKTCPDTHACSVCMAAFPNKTAMTQHCDKAHCYGTAVKNLF